MDKEILDVVLLVTQILILITLVLYVIKMWRIGSATHAAADVFALSLAVMKETRDLEIAPNVVVYFDIPPGGQIIFFVVKNIGKSTARDVRIQLKPMLVGNAGEDFSELPIMKDGIVSLPPNHEIRMFVDSALAFFFEESDRPLVYESTVSFYGGLKDSQRFSEQVLDLTTYKKLSKVSQRSTHEMANEVEKISGSLERISRELAELNDSLSGGVQLRHPITSASVKAEQDSWQQVITSRLLEFKHLWSTLYGGNREKLLQPFLGKLKNRLSHITDQILVTTSLCPPNTCDELKDRMLDVVAKLADLNSLPISTNDAKSVSEFNSNGDKILGNIEELVTQIKKTDSAR